MTPFDIENWAREFASSLLVGGERIPIDRAIAAHLSAFEHLRSAGLTWPAISMILTKAGARRKDGGPISPDQLRADVSRHIRRRSSAVELPSRVRQSKITRRMGPKSRLQSSQSRIQSVHPNETETKAMSESSKDISILEIAAALRRLNQK